MSEREIPRSPALRILKAFVLQGTRLDVRAHNQTNYEEFGPVVGQGWGRFKSVNLYGPDANRFVLLDRDKIFSAREPWMMIMGKIFPNGLLLWRKDGGVSREMAHLNLRAYGPAP